MVLHILQWNARSLIANGQEFKKYIHELDVPDAICVQETWLRDRLDYVIPGFSSIRYDRPNNQTGGGCITFIKDGLAYRESPSSEDSECIIVEIYSPRKEGNVKLINFYNPCKNLDINKLNEMAGTVYRKEIWCGDFNAHNSLWGSNHTDNNGDIIEEMMEERSLVCINNGQGTRMDVNRGKTSCLDIALVSDNLVNACEWFVMNDSTIGSDHFPVLTIINTNVCFQEGSTINRWCFEKADWEKFRLCCTKSANLVMLEGDVEECTKQITEHIINAAHLSIPKRTTKGRKKVVPWWNEECSRAVKERNKAFKTLKKNLSQECFGFSK